MSLGVQRSGVGPGGIRVEVGPELRRWAKGLAGARLRGGDADLWDQAVDVMFAATQAAVHILSGDLKRSGRVEHHRSASMVRETIKYGGIPGQHHPDGVDYAWYEQRRGGSHDFIAPAARVGERYFADAMEESGMDLMRRAIRGG